MVNFTNMVAKGPGTGLKESVWRQERELWFKGVIFKFLTMSLTESCSCMGELGVMVSQQGFFSISLTLTRLCVCVYFTYFFN